jgi:hypothetical protein
MPEEKPRRLWVCWKEPGVAPDPSDSILTFLLPSAERHLKLQHSGEVVFGREASLAVRKEARRTYLGVAARLPATPLSSGKTVRQLMASPGEASQWWYHRVSFKDCEADPTFDRIIALFTILRVAEDRRIRDLVLVGGPAEFGLALKELFRCESSPPQLRSFNGLLYSGLTALASRLAFGLKTAYECWLARRHPIHQKLDIAFSGFWNWSVGPRYFGDLPKALQAGRDRSVGWLVWLDDHVLPSRDDRSSICLLQRELGLQDLVASLLDFSPCLALITAYRDPAFKGVFQVGNVNLFPFFKRPLLQGVLDSSIPYGELVATATERACRRLQPSATFSFLEHFPYARAHYEGVRRSGAGAVNYTIQHASYCSEKTFLFLDPELEFRGTPDGCAVPHPDYVLAMGTLPRELFLQCGYDDSQVLLTGSPRYDRIKTEDSPSKPAEKGLRLLLVGGLAVGPDIEMIDAACEAAKSLPDLSVAYRKHPLSRIKADRVRMTNTSLDEDLQNADIILFTYSTVAEEAFLRGRPVWQWLPEGFNASALSEVTSIPRFGSIDSLCEALRSGSARYVPDASTRASVLAQLFHSGDGQAAARIAGILGTDT